MTLAGYLSEAHFLSLTTMIMGLSMLHGNLEPLFQSLLSHLMHILLGSDN